MKENTYKVISPLKVIYGYSKEGKPKVFSLNLNIYRNSNKFILNKAKQCYSELMTEPVKNLPNFNKIKLEYVLYTGSNRKVDIMNILSITDKFFCDVLTKLGKLPDDNYQYLDYVSFKFGGVDKINPRIEIYITSYA